MSIIIKPISLEIKAEKEAFIKFAWKIYEGDKNWVAPLLMDMRARLNLKHPFFEYGEMQLFMAYRNDAAVGRIAAVKNNGFNEFHQDKTGFFGFFECVNDQEVANALLDTAKKWLQERGLDQLVGPASPSSNYDYGLLVEGFDDAPRLMMTYNPPYYKNLMENYGLRKIKGLLAYKMERETLLKNEKFGRVAKAAEQRSGITLRPINLKKMKEEMLIVKELYNKSWENNWGFVPMTDREFDAMAAELKPIADPSLIQIGYIDGKPIGIGLALLDYNEIIKGFDGRLFPFNFLKLFLQKKRIHWIRVVLLGILPEYRGRGLDAVFYHKLIENGMQYPNFQYGEASWILEDNAAMNRGMEVVNGKVYKVYNIYGLKI